MFRAVAFFFLIKGKIKEAVPVLLGSHRNCVAPNVV